MANWARRWAVVCVFLGLLGLPRVARAQPTANDVYQDAKEVIEQLITKEVAETVAPRIACYSPAGLMLYYPRTLQLIFERNFGALQQSLRDETITLFGNYAFASLTRGRPLPLSEFLPTANTAVCDADENCCTSQIRRKGGPELYLRSLSPPHKYPLDRCKQLDETTNAADGLACNVVLAAMEAARGRAAVANERVVRAIATVVFHRLLPDLPKLDPHSTRALFENLVAALRQRLESGEFPEKSELWLASAASLQRVRGVLVEKSLLQILKLRSESVAVRRMAAAVRLIEHPEHATVVASGACSGTQTFVQALDGLGDAALRPRDGESLGSAVARTLVERAGCATPGVIDVSVVADGEGLKIQLRADASPGPARGVGSGLTLLENLYQAVKLRSSLEDKLIGLHATGADQQQRLLMAMLQVRDEVERLLRQWGKLARNADGKVDIPEFFSILAQTLFSEEKCDASHVQPGSDGRAPRMATTLCGVIKQAAAVFDPTQGELVRLFDALVAKDMREVAMAASRAVFSSAVRERLCCDSDDEDSCLKQLELFGRLTTSFVSYALVDRDDGDSRLAARTAFKSAAYDVLLAIGEGGGIDREQVFRGLPTPALRASWSTGYVNPSGKTLRYVATVDELSFMPQLYRNPSSSLYIGLQVSLLDLLGPFSELALRDQDPEYHLPYAVFANFFTPRVELLVGIPALTSHLVVSGGVSLRSAVPQRLADSSDYKYTSYWATLADNQFDDGDVWMDSLEMSFAVKYVP